MTDSRPLPRTTDDPRWPAFRAWADVHLPNAMLGAYWECWKAAHAAGDPVREAQARGFREITVMLLDGRADREPGLFLPRVKEIARQAAEKGA